MADPQITWTTPAAGLLPNDLYTISPKFGDEGILLQEAIMLVYQENMEVIYTLFQEQLIQDKHSLMQMRQEVQDLIYLPM